ncbi:MAG: ACT domain-containing protein [Planctomycetes bacterium]|nr:ACT domain-containing protein [Planctomycetota bacterium]
MARNLITRGDVAGAPQGQPLRVGPDAVITPAALDLAQERGLSVIRSGAAPGESSRIAGPPPRRPPLGEPQAGPAPRAQGPMADEADRRLVGAPRRSGRPSETKTSVVVSVVGKNRTHVLAELTGRVAELGGDIVDITQRLIAGYFSMVMVVDIRGVQGSFGDFRRALEALSKENDYQVTVQHEKIFRTMHRV